MGNFEMIQSQIICYCKQQACIRHWKLWVFAGLRKHLGRLTWVHGKQTFPLWKRSQFPFAVPLTTS